MLQHASDVAESQFNRMSKQRFSTTHSVDTFLGAIRSHGNVVVLADMSVSISTNNRKDCQEQCLYELLQTLVEKKCGVGIGLWNTQVRTSPVFYRIVDFF